jgi:hypothetical protein
MEAQRRAIKTGRVVLGILIGGVTFVCATLTWLASANKEPLSTRTGYMLLGGLAVLCYLEIGAARTARWAFKARARRFATTAQGNSRDLLVATAFLNTMVVTAAFIAGPALFGGVIVFLSKQWLALAAPIIAIPLLIRLIPTSAKFEQFTHDVTAS